MLGHAVQAIKQRMVVVWFAFQIVFLHSVARRDAVKQSCLVVVLVRNPEALYYRFVPDLRSSLTYDALSGMIGRLGQGCNLICVSKA